MKKDNHILIIGSGRSIKKYKNKIKEFIKENRVIIIGINHIDNIAEPDYHFWGSSHRWRKFGKFASKKSLLIFPSDFSKKLIHKHFDGDYKKYKTGERPYGFDKKIYKTIYHCFKNTLMTAIFWAYSNKFSKIDVVGMDGYTYYPEKELKNKKYSQHCYGKGYTDGQTYKFGRKKDVDYYNKLKMLYKWGKKKYRFGFEILTPTVYVRFYNSDILKIEEKYQGEAPSLKEKKELKNARKNRFLKRSKYW